VTAARGRDAYVVCKARLFRGLLGNGCLFESVGG
jgi:hypothetical protein